MEKVGVLAVGGSSDYTMLFIDGNYIDDDVRRELFDFDDKPLAKEDLKELLQKLDKGIRD